jgi:hypothetical protein
MVTGANRRETGRMILGASNSDGCKHKGICFLSLYPLFSLQSTIKLHHPDFSCPPSPPDFPCGRKGSTPPPPPPPSKNDPFASLYVKTKRRHRYGTRFKAELRSFWLEPLTPKQHQHHHRTEDVDQGETSENSRFDHGVDNHWRRRTPGEGRRARAVKG